MDLMPCSGVEEGFNEVLLISIFGLFENDNLLGEEEGGWVRQRCRVSDVPGASN